MEINSKDAPQKLTDNEKGVLSEHAASEEQAILEVTAPFLREAEEQRTRILEMHHQEQLASIEPQLLESERKARKEAPLVIKNPKNRPPEQ